MQILNGIPDRRISRRLYWGLNFLLIFFAVAWLQNLLRTPEPFDDAYMFLRYAYRILHDGVIGWNTDEPAYGCTSMGYLLSNVLLLKLFPGAIHHPAIAITLHSYLWGIASLLMLYRCLKLLISTPSLHAIHLPRIVILLVLIAPLFFHNLLSGMDTSMALFANTLLIYVVLRHLRNPSSVSLLLIALTAYFAFFVRPDSGMYALLFPALLLWKHDQRKELIIFGLIFFAFLSIDAAGKYAYFGYVLPLSAYVKSWAYYDPYTEISFWNYFFYLSELIISFLSLILISIFLFRRQSVPALIPYLIPVLLTYLYFSTTTQIMGSYGRFYLPGIPFWICSIAILIDHAFQQSRLRLNLTAGMIWVPLILAIFLLGGNRYFASLQQRAETEAAAYKIPWEGIPNYPVLDWDQTITRVNTLLDQLPPDLRIAASEHGFLGIDHPDQHIVCLAGIHNNLFVDRSIPKEEILSRSLQQQQPELIWMAHFAYVKLNYDMIRSDFFQAEYDFYPVALNHGLAIRKNSAYRDVIPRFIQKSYGLENAPQPVSYDHIHFPQ